MSTQMFSSRAIADSVDVEQWIDECGKILYRFAFFKVKDVLTAEELVQETLVSAWRSRAAFDGRSSTKTWLVSILRNKVADYFRQRARESRLRSAEFEELDGWPATQNSDPVADLEQEELAQLLESSVSRLPPRLRDAYFLRVLEDRSATEVCSLLGISPCNLSMRLRRARLALGALMQRWDSHPSR